MGKNTTEIRKQRYLLQYHPGCAIFQ